MSTATERFEELQALGRGGMGEVLKARDRLLEREVAIKRLLPEQDDAESVQRFLSEARSTSQLEHPNIPALYDLGEDADGKPYFALKLVRGESLRGVIERLQAGDRQLHERFRFPHRLQVFQKVCQAVAYAHGRGVLHRDIKPENVMLGELGEVFLLDWGLATSAAESTSSTVFEGTPAYAAPEQLTGEPITAQTDVYGLGALLYEWLTLQPPFTGKDVNAVLTGVLTRAPVHPFTVRCPVQDRAPVEMCHLVMKLLHKQPDKRLTMQQLLAEVQGLIEGDVCPVCPTTTFRYGLHRLNRWLDNYPLLLVVLMLWLLYPLYALVDWLL
jgi:eukaryotic-like serine/threonine-protein kinase